MVGAVVIYAVLSSISLVASGLLLLLYVALLPWLINRGLRFNAAMTSWSNLRFGFGGNYWSSFQVFLLYPFLSAFSLYLALPFVTREVVRYKIESHRLGEHRFTFDSGVKPFYAALLICAIWAIFGVVLLAVLATGGGVLADFAFAVETGVPMDSLTIAYMVILAVIAFVTFFPLGVIYAAFIRNAIYAGTSLEGGHRFESTVSAWRLVWIVLSNAAAVVVSVGMLLPWTHIRLARYLCACTHVKPAGALDEFVGEAGRRQSAIGDAFLDIEGVDVGAAV